MTPQNAQGQAPGVERDVVRAVASVNDPEYPDVSIVDLGLLERVTVTGSVATIGLIPTFSGCPALQMIADDVRNAVEAVPGIERCEVEWLSAPAWSTDRISSSAARRLADDYTVVVRRSDGELTCPVCGGHAVVDQSMAGPTRCRSVAWCPDCRNPIEVMRVDGDTGAWTSVEVRVGRSDETRQGLEMAR
ncbi:MAG: 1,2-phenylacetyl-CoA epoxidase subunit PaaD [Ilumatobacter sp.]|uniref:1,2-phenylacetyl-CoA epoxidase subunit PaaD n=1 Tax=Ilumatobacter sp. TaxID=1967498 RepID=UPI00391A6F0D